MLMNYPYILNISSQDSYSDVEHIHTHKRIQQLHHSDC